MGSISDMKIKHSIAHRIWKFFKPTMVAVKRWNGQKLVNTRIGNTTHIGNGVNLILGNHVFIGHYNMLDASGGIKIGDGCQLASYISILNHSSHIAIRLYGENYSNEPAPEPYFRGTVELGRYTFVGPNTVIMPGTRIGKGSLVSAYSYVKGEFDDFSIISGNPARRVGDTRELDRKHLESHPHLRKFYEAWSQ